MNIASLKPVLDELLTKRAGLAAELAAHDEAIAALTPLCGNGTAVTASAKPGPKARAATPKPAKAGKGRKDWDRGRQLWDQGKSAEDIAKALGCSTAAIYYQVKANKWPKRAAAAAPAKAKAGKGKTVEIHRCQGCEQMTDKDPCAHCGAQWRGKDWDG